MEVFGPSTSFHRHSLFAFSFSFVCAVWSPLLVIRCPSPSYSFAADILLLMSFQDSLIGFIITFSFFSFSPFFLTFTAHREMRTITNYFLLNLSVADLLMSSLNCIFNFIYMLNSDWPFGPIYCTVNNFMGNLTVAASVFTLVAISFDR